MDAFKCELAFQEEFYFLEGVIKLKSFDVKRIDDANNS